MEYQEFKNTRPFRILTNVYVIILTVFVVWMLFFDENSYLTQRKFNKEIEKLEKWNKYHKQKIKEDKETIKKLQDDIAVKRYAREKYLMKKDNEDIYIIEFDTLK